MLQYPWNEIKLKIHGNYVNEHNRQWDTLLDTLFTQFWWLIPNWFVKRGANAGRGVFSADTSANIWPLKSPAWYLKQTNSFFKIQIKLSFSYFLQYSYLNFSFCHARLISHNTEFSEVYLFNRHDKIWSMVNIHKPWRPRGALEV